MHSHKSDLLNTQKQTKAPNSNELTTVGKISGYHGVRGEVKIHPLLDDPSEFKELKILYINGKRYEVKSQRIHKAKVLVKLVGVESLTQAEQEISGYVEANYEIWLEEDEFLIENLKDCEIYDTQSKLYGKVINFVDNMQPLLEVKLEKEFAKKRSLFVPFVEKYIESIDEKSNKITIKNLEELMEIVI